jgi:hypothetical protein
VLAVIGFWPARPARAGQFGVRISPGPLAKVHAALEGIGNCGRCHEAGRELSAARCLTCHKPVADRIAKNLGVHRDLKGDCVKCHVEHTGVEGDLRPFDQRHFDHARVAGFPLDGRHAVVADKCAACHKTRSFLTAGTSCQACHADVHKGRLGSTCESCHTTQVAFKDVVAAGRFDHSKSAFPLLGAHSTVACARCHVNGVFKGLAFGSCTSCHREPHQPSFGAVCTSCHTTTSWRTEKVNHARTAFPLIGRHATVACTSCHKQSAMTVKPRAATCAVCHLDVHRGTFKQDCKACHSESGFQKTPFDHSQTKFLLAGKHTGVACADCHKSVVLTGVAASRRTADFRGLKTECASCHTDVHRGELGAACASCHADTGFRVTSFKHPRWPEFFGGQHAAVTCEKCHRRTGVARPVTARVDVLDVAFKNLATGCASCHADVHLGQMGVACETCHNIDGAKFSVVGFSHATTGFPLTGRHTTIACVDCHKSETGIFPTGAGTAVRLKGLAVQCRACHADVHLGQLTDRCDSCHSTDRFKLPKYRHANPKLRRFFIGRHATARCQSCHGTVTRDFPGGRGTATLFRLDARCPTCHRDAHSGSLPDCSTCHHL